MKLLVFSDSHRNIDRMLFAAKQINPDAIIHLGDHISDARELQMRLPEMICYMVTGNCDSQSSGKSELFLPLEGTNIFLTHGHNYGVKRGLTALKDKARAMGADLALYGHTHRAALQNEHGLWLMCPGQMERHDNVQAASYGIVRIENGSFECGIEVVPKFQ